jgi:hypothetical protein
VWYEAPHGFALKYKYLDDDGFRGVGMWTADAVAAVSQYWWGGGCDGSKTVKVCPQNLTLTTEFPEQMWAATPKGGQPM